MSKQTIKIEKLMTRASVDKSTLDRAKRTVEVVIATETTDVTRYDWRTGNYFVEKLIISPDTVRMERINAGAPLLDDHNSWGGVRSSLGKIENGSGKIVGKEIRCTLRFSKRKAVEEIMDDVADGIISCVSVGYRVFKYERQPVVDGETEVRHVIDWEPMEVSLTLIPADIKSGVRSQAEIRGVEDSATEMEVEIVDSEPIEDTIETGTRSVKTKNSNSQNNNNPLKNHNDMKLEARALAVGLPATATETEVAAAERKLELTKRAVALGLSATATETEIETAERAEKAKNTGDLTKQGAEAERARTTEITTLVRKMKLSAEFGDKLIGDGTSIEEARKLVIDEVSKGDPNIRNNVNVTGKDEVEKKRDAISAALVIRSGALEAKEITKEEREVSQEYRYMSLMDLAKLCLEKDAPGSTRGLDKMEIAKRAITSHTSDFPVLLEGTNRRILLSAYKTAPDKWRSFCSIGSVGDFREYKRVRPGSLTRLDALAENSEYKNKALTDGVSAGVSVETFGNIINISRQMIINDDLKAFTSLTKALGRAAARGIEIDVFALLAENSGKGPTMGDGKALFHVDHNNLIDTGTGGVPSMAQFDLIRTTLSSQKDNDSNDYLDIVAAILLCPIGKLGLATSINKSIYDPDAANKLQKPNIVQDMFGQVVGTPRLSGNPYYAFADPNDHEVLEVSFLDGQEAPFMESHMPFNVDGIQWKVRQDYGVAAVDYKGAALNMGA